MALDLVETLSRLVAIPSVNPMGRDVLGAEYGEAELTDCLESIFSEMGLRCLRQKVHPGRDNLIARLDGEVPCTSGGPLLLFGVHQDTVPVEGMTVEPFTPRVEGRRLYGRGSCDVKGSMAAMLVALDRLARERPKGMPNVVMACTVNEEYGFTGAEVLAQLCRTPGGDILPRRPDAAVVAEPTGLDVVVAHKGVVRWKCRTEGVAGHSARPEDGQNAIYNMSRVLTALERYQRESVAGLSRHPLCGRPTLSVGTIHGGVSVNTIPDSCTIEIDRRLCPGEDAPAAIRHAVDYLALDEAIDSSVFHDPPYMLGPALSDDANDPVAQRVEKVAREVVGKCRRLGVPYATDAAFLADAGVPTVVFGPGSIRQAHTADESISLDELGRGAEIYYRLASTAWHPAGC